jgi:2-polyprenyl-3-methyl-5-hydroxy-6-metoxy-1,4-benzoquinol methylase
MIAGSDVAAPDVAASDLAALAALKYGDLAQGGWAPRLRHRFGYYTPDDWYEACVWGLAGPETDWLDVGCGRAPFPSNDAAARLLAERCRSLTGLDPSDNIDDNPFLHHRAKCMLEEFRPARQFDLVTLRMVAEHVTDPAASVAALAQLTRPGGHVVIYTVNKWSPVSLVSAVTPMPVHHAVKSVLWGGEERDTFPTSYKMNTRKTLRRLFEGAGFLEARFAYLSDTRVSGRWRAANTVELVAWRVLRGVGVTYPENCLLGVYKKV